MKKNYLLILVLVVLLLFAFKIRYLTNQNIESTSTSISYTSTPSPSTSSPEKISTTSFEISKATDSLQSHSTQSTTSANKEDKKGEKFYTMDEVAKHNSKESCWTVIRGDVYDLTEWINKHPGGADKILSICGKDGTQKFVQKHGGKEKAEETLEKFEIGKLKNQ